MSTRKISIAFHTFASERKKMRACRIMVFGDRQSDKQENMKRTREEGKH